MSLSPQPVRPLPQIEEWESWARTVGLLVGDRERVLFDKDEALGERLRVEAAGDLAKALPDPHYSGWRIFFVIVLGFATFSTIAGIPVAIRDGIWGISVAVTTFVLLLDCVWLSSEQHWRRRVAVRMELRMHLAGVAARAAMEVIRARRIRTRTKSHEGAAPPKFEAQWPPPFPQPYGVNDVGAEALAGDWMRHLGAVDTTVTRASPGVSADVSSSRYISRTKNDADTVGVVHVRELAGACVADGRRGLYFTSGTYAPAAVDLADSAGIALFTFSAERGTLSAANPNAQLILHRGL